MITRRAPYGSERITVITPGAPTGALDRLGRPTLAADVETEWFGRVFRGQPALSNIASYETTAMGVENSGILMCEMAATVTPESQIIDSQGARWSVDSDILVREHPRMTPRAMYQIANLKGVKRASS